MFLSFRNQSKIKHRLNRFFSSSSIQLRGDYSVALFFESYYLPSETDKNMLAYHLYPYQTIKLTAIFVYGEDFTRQMSILSIPDSLRLMAILILIFFWMAALVLYSIRKKWKLSNANFLSSFIDTMVTFTAGGNLRMQHKFERWFFGVMLIGAFFISSLFVGEFLDKVYSVIHQKVNTLDEATEMNPPIYVPPTLDVHEIHAILKFVEYHHI